MTRTGIDSRSLRKRPFARIAPKILPKLRAGDFVAAFLAKGRFRQLLESIPVRVILDPHTALYGAALHAAEQLAR